MSQPENSCGTYGRRYVFFVFHIGMICRGESFLTSSERGWVSQLSEKVCASEVSGGLNSVLVWSELPFRVKYPTRYSESVRSYHVRFIGGYVCVCPVDAFSAAFICLLEFGHIIFLSWHAAI